MGKNPAFQFYPGDWDRDLKEHSLEIRGAWITICCALWWGEERGKLKKPLTNWARVLGVGDKKSLSIITYLNKAGIADINSNNEGIEISCRRMLRDEKIREIRKKVGSLGGNPAFEKGKPNPYYLDNQKDKQKDNQKITPSVLLSSSSKNRLSFNTKYVSREKPTLEQITAYCQERKNTVDPEKWMNHYESNGWMIGKNPMKDWKAAVRTWEKNQGGFQNERPGANRTNNPALPGIKSTKYAGLETKIKT
ncbi:MAG: hypothetical protein QME78_13140 [Thermodesulfobacteriota bacterium]|nr:hypothetical protein [Thermodesulfobacteriota bacterium]